MISVFFPLKKLRRNSKCLLFSAILLVCAVAVYNEMYAARAWSSDPSLNAAADENSWRRAMFDQWFRKDQANDMEDSAAWASSYTPQTWKPESDQTPADLSAPYMYSTTVPPPLADAREKRKKKKRVEKRKKQ